jgi:hypothetical protein
VAEEIKWATTTTAAAAIHLSVAAPLLTSGQCLLPLNLF